MANRIVIAGGGLAGGLLAWRIRQRFPSQAIVVLEQASRLGGNHTWSFFATDLAPEHAAFLAPLVCYRWDGHDVRFPAFSRTLTGGYRTLTAERFHDVLVRELGDAVRFGTKAEGIETTEGDLWIDARGPSEMPGVRLGWQKFVGQEVLLREAHGITRPIIMDATVPQTGGYRFFYVLPFTPETCLIEETRYSRDPTLDPVDARNEIATYAASQGWAIEEVRREEQGVLPIVLEGEFHEVWPASDVPRAGLRAGLFHHATGYSLPEAVRFAFAATEALANGIDFPTWVRSYAKERWRRQGFFRMLNRMLLYACPPEERVEILQRVYSLPEHLLEHFYAGNLSMSRKLQILASRPPVSLGAAILSVVRGEKGKPAWKHLAP